MQESQNRERWFSMESACGMSYSWFPDSLGFSANSINQFEIEINAMNWWAHFPYNVRISFSENFIWIVRSLEHGPCHTWSMHLTNWPPIIHECNFKSKLLLHQVLWLTSCDIVCAHEICGDILNISRAMHINLILLFIDSLFVRAFDSVFLCCLETLVFFWSNVCIGGAVFVCSFARFLPLPIKGTFNLYFCLFSSGNSFETDF